MHVLCHTSANKKLVWNGCGRGKYSHWAGRYFVKIPNTAPDVKNSLWYHYQSIFLPSCTSQAVQQHVFLSSCHTHQRQVEGVGPVGHVGEKDAHLHVTSHPRVSDVLCNFAKSVAGGQLGVDMEAAYLWGQERAISITVI